jgi:hypothetical protein
LRSLPFAGVLETLLRSLLVRDPHNRPSAAAALQLVDSAIAATVGASPSRHAPAGDTPHLAPAPAAGDPLPPRSPGAEVLPPLLSSSLKCGLKDCGMFVFQLSPGVLVAHHAAGTGLSSVLTPHAWMDSTLAVNEGSTSGPASAVLRALGVTHVVRVQNGASRTVDGVDLSAKTGAPTELVLLGNPLTPTSIDEAVLWVERALQVGGSIIITGTAAPHRAQPQPGASEWCLPDSEGTDDSNMCCSAIALAVIMARNQLPLYDALLEARSSHAALRLSRSVASLLMVWWGARVES